MRVLRSWDEVEEAEASLCCLRLDPHHVKVKCWDLWLTVDYILKTAPSSSATILDGGARASPILEVLRTLGYKSLFGCDLAWSLRDRLRLLIQTNARSKTKIRISRQDLTATSYPSGFFDIVTCLSVIEHGVDTDALLKEMSRLLKAGGSLITSTDYWCSELRTDDIHPYGARFGPMKVFTPQEIESLVSRAPSYGLHLVGELDQACGEKVVTWERVGKSFTFILFVLKKIKN